MPAGVKAAAWIWPRRRRRSHATLLRRGVRQGLLVQIADELLPGETRVLGSKLLQWRWCGDKWLRQLHFRGLQRRGLGRGRLRDGLHGCGVASDVLRGSLGPRGRRGRGVALGGLQHGLGGDHGHPGLQSHRGPSELRVAFAKPLPEVLAPTEAQATEHDDGDREHHLHEKESHELRDERWNEEPSLVEFLHHLSRLALDDGVRRLRRRRLQHGAAPPEVRFHHLRDLPPDAETPGRSRVAIGRALRLDLCLPPGVLETDDGRLLRGIVAGQEDLRALAWVPWTIGEVRLVLLPRAGRQAVHHVVLGCAVEAIRGTHHGVAHLQEGLHSWCRNRRTEDEAREAEQRHDPAAAMQGVARAEAAHEPRMILLHAQVATEGHKQANRDCHANLGDRMKGHCGDSGIPCPEVRDAAYLLERVLKGRDVEGPLEHGPHHHVDRDEHGDADHAAPDLTVLAAGVHRRLRRRREPHWGQRLR
mmetsp:Transcript_52306/g.167721  ORF Transcript_52306/g.167721 Transcript_52306/m.167721 type:complete len:475 (+) Transcript_52306:91-1515(+)